MTRQRLAFVAIAAVAAAAAGLGGYSLNNRSGTLDNHGELRLALDLPAGVRRFALSPDGQQIAFVAPGQGAGAVWVRRLDADNAIQLHGTDGAKMPYWSPDSRSILFFTATSDGGEEMKRVDIANGLVRTLTTVGNSRGAAWASDGTIVYAPSPSSTSFWRVSAEGGPATELKLRGLAADVTFTLPVFAGDARHLLFFGVTAAPRTARIYLADLDTLDTTALLDSDSGPILMGPDVLLFSRNGDLFAQRIDVANRTRVGQPVRAAGQVYPETSGGIIALSAAANGMIAYATGQPVRTAARLQWFDRSGQALATVVDRDDAFAFDWRLSHDQHTVAVARVEVSGNSDEYLIDMARGTRRRLTTEPRDDSGAVWSPDDSELVFTTTRQGPGDLYRKRIATAEGNEQPLLVDARRKVATDWSPDGQTLLFQTGDEGAPLQGDIWALKVADLRTFPVVKTTFIERNAVFSPDGAWIAYQSNQSGRDEVYIQRLDSAGAAVQVSTDGGTLPVWPRQSKELFYVGAHAIMSVVLNLAKGDQVPHPSAPVRLFDLPSQWPGGVQARYQVSADGSRFLIPLDVVAEQSAASVARIVVNWSRRP